MAEDSEEDQKTEPPTSKRLGEARERGQLPVSRDMATFIVLVCSLLVITYLGPPMADRMTSSLRIFIENPHQISLEGLGIQTALFIVMKEMGLATVLIFSLMMAASILGTMVQTDFFMEPNMLKFDLEKLSPMNGIRKIFSAAALVELIKNFCKLVLIGGLAALLLIPLINKFSLFTGHRLIEVLAAIHSETIHVIVILLIVVLIISVADLLYQRHSYFKQLRMTKTEVKDEFKQMEGDPMIKARLRQIRIDKFRKRMMANVPKADVIITNPTHYAIALQYDGLKMNAPVVLAKGLDLIAQRIKEIAAEHNIPTVSNPPLARALYKSVEIDQPIKAEHYRAVAEIISYVFKLRKKKR
ncbi:MAG: flagellar biosynthesis protein FlhB [Alphaproteobacteria bacterium]|nr:flagellar biosynthesis protein FlhB [Alphaproteobacteria bacterium]